MFFMAQMLIRLLFTAKGAREFSTLNMTRKLIKFSAMTVASVTRKHTLEKPKCNRRFRTTSYVNRPARTFTDLQRALASNTLAAPRP